MIEIIPLDTPSLGDRSYVVTDGAVAVVVDPQRDIDRVLAVTRPRGLRITHVLETHIHNDYVTGGLALARQEGARYVVAAADAVSYERHGVRDGDVLTTGALQVRVLATPGHTFNHLAYVVEADGEVQGVFSGGSLLYGSTGRPDLLGSTHAETLARAQYRSAHRLAEELPPATSLYPTHGFGSFCAATQSEGDASTLAAEARGNPVLTSDEEAYVATLLEGLDAYPAYYAHMGPRNAAGPQPVDLSPPGRADADELRRRIEAGEWVVDLRERTAFGAGHVHGTINLGLDGSFVTYLGWLIPWGVPVTLLGATMADVEAAQRDLVRIGIDRPAAAATGAPQDWTDGPLVGLRLATFRDLREAMAREDVAVVDVRLDLEREDAHVAGSLHVPLHELPGRSDELPHDRELWIHCAAGYRAAAAASLLEAAGARVVVIDDEFDQAATAGVPLEAAARPAA